MRLLVIIIALFLLVLLLCNCCMMYKLRGGVHEHEPKKEVFDWTGVPHIYALLGAIVEKNTKHTQPRGNDKQKSYKFIERYYKLKRPIQPINFSDGQMFDLNNIEDFYNTLHAITPIPSITIMDNNVIGLPWLCTSSLLFAHNIMIPPTVIVENMYNCDVDKQLPEATKAIIRELPSTEEYVRSSDFQKFLRDSLLYGFIPTWETISQINSFSGNPQQKIKTFKSILKNSTDCYEVNYNPLRDSKGIKPVLNEFPKHTDLNLYNKYNGRFLPVEDYDYNITLKLPRYEIKYNLWKVGSEDILTINGKEYNFMDNKTASEKIKKEKYTDDAIMIYSICNAIRDINVYIFAKIMLKHRQQHNSRAYLNIISSDNIFTVLLNMFKDFKSYWVYKDCFSISEILPNT